jgi:hypothetical protein
LACWLASHSVTSSETGLKAQSIRAAFGSPETGSSPSIVKEQPGPPSRTDLHRILRVWRNWHGRGRPQPPEPSCGSRGRSHPSIRESPLSTRKTPSPREKGRNSYIVGRKTPICTPSKAYSIGVLDFDPRWTLDEPTLAVVQSSSPNGIPPFPTVHTRASCVDNMESVDSPLERNDPPARGNDSPFERSVPPQEENGSPPEVDDPPPEVSGLPLEVSGLPLEVSSPPPKVNDSPSKGNRFSGKEEGSPPEGNRFVVKVESSVRTEASRSRERRHRAL